MTSGYMTILFISIGQMPFFVTALDNSDPLFTLVINKFLYAPCGGDPGSGSLYADTFKRTNSKAFL